MCWEAKDIDEILKYAKYSSDWVEIKKKGDDKVMTVQTVRQPTVSRRGGMMNASGANAGMNQNMRMTNPNIELLKKTTPYFGCGQCGHWK